MPAPYSQATKLIGWWIDDGQMDRERDGWDRQMDGWVDGWTDGLDAS